MKFDNFKSKAADICRKIGKRNFIIIGTVALVVCAVVVNLVIAFNNEDGGSDYDQSAGMNGGGADTTTTVTPPDTSTSDSYFSSVQVSRQRTRDEAIEVLQSVVENAASSEAAKNEALSQINALADVMEAEANIEALIVAKGFSECVAVISDGTASVVVKSDGLLPAQISQINEIVYLEAGIEPVNITIIER